MKSIRVARTTLNLEKILAQSSARRYTTKSPLVNLISGIRCDFQNTIAGPSRRCHSSHHAPLPLEEIPEIEERDNYDIVIIGGANAGLALACALLDQPSIRSTSKILILEGGSLDRVRDWTGTGPWENRVSSLTAENVAWLDKIGAWEHIVQERSCPVEEMVVWANPTRESTPAIHFPPLDQPMARMTENTNLQRALLRRIEQVGQGIVTIRENTRVGEMRLGQGGRWVGLRIGDESWIRGSVVVGADGPNSPVRQFSGINSPGHGYETHGVVATLHHDPDLLYPNHTAFQRFLPTGPIAFLPLSPTASTMVWSTLPPHAAALKRLSMEALAIVVNAGYTMHEEPLSRLMDEIVRADQAKTPLSSETISSMVQELNIHSDAFLTNEQAILPSTVKSIDPKSVASFPLRLSHAETYLGERTVLVGDAAHTTHPLAGQGLNMGLADVRVLASVWEKSRSTGGDLGARIASLDYPRQRWSENALMLTAVDTFHHVFRNRSKLLNMGRGMAFDIINEIGPVKKLFMGGAGANNLGNRQSGWGSTGANALENWIGFKNGLGTAATFVGEIAKNSLGRAAGGLGKK